MRYVWLFFSVFLLASCSSPISTEENPLTANLSVAIPEAGHVHVWIENAYQTKVKTLANKYLPAGTHVFPLEMKNKNGTPLPFGIYTYHIKAKNFNVSRTLMYFSPNKTNG